MAGRGWREALYRYGRAFLITAAAILLRIAIAPLIGNALPFFTCLVAAIYLASSSGFWPAAFSVLLSASVGSHFILGNSQTLITGLEMREREAVLAFVITALAINWLVDFQRRTLIRARAAEAAQRAIAAENARLFAQAEAAREALGKSNAELQSANRDLESFAYSLSHDLQEPLRGISIFAELLEKASPVGDGTGVRYLDEIRKASRRMTILIRDVLAYAGLSAVEESSPAVADSGRVVREAIESLEALIAETQAVVTLEGDLPAVAIHPSRLAQVFQNLIGNALKYRREVCPRIRIGATKQESHWIFSIEDNGLGIEPEYSERIFGLFKRLHPDHVIPGTGVGLAICRRIVERYGGRIWLAQSTPGEGSVFSFSIPATVPVSQAKQAQIA